MIIKAAGPRDGCPFVPKYLVLEDGSVALKPGLAAGVARVPGEDFQLSGPLDVRHGSWIGISGAGISEAFELSQEGPWRAKEAEKSITLAYSGLKEDPLKSAALIKAAAALVGLDVPALVHALEAQRLPGETLEAVFERVKRPSG